MRGTERWHDLARPTRIFGVVVALSAIASVALTDTPVQGLAQRIVAVIVPLGVVALAVRVLQLAVPAPSSRSGERGLASRRQRDDHLATYLDGREQALPFRASRG